MPSISIGTELLLVSKDTMKDALVIITQLVLYTLNNHGHIRSLKHKVNHLIHHQHKEIGGRLNSEKENSSEDPWHNWHKSEEESGTQLLLEYSGKDKRTPHCIHWVQWWW